ncbi:SUKH-4 family immunity protein [Streptomyces sp. NPDC052013]|uniref:SUKH-4 family immunity protein n=1 Tax=Streptomyces sp. NPDC052013 TaxID=3365679 RepID=UPI0037D6D995
MNTTGKTGIAALAASTGTSFGLALVREFGRGGVFRFEEVDFPGTLTHEPTRRFLSETGLPEDGGLFALDTDLPLRTLTEYYADDHEEGFRPEALPADAGRLIRLGRLRDGNSLVVDGTTGALLHWNEPESSLVPLHADVSTLALALCLLHRKRASAGCSQGASGADTRGEFGA